MISFITMAANALGGLLVSALKAFFSLLSWFIKHFLNVLKVFYCALPLAAVCFVFLFVINIISLLFGEFSLSDSADSSAISILAPILNKGFSSTLKMFSDLKDFWISSIYVYHGSAVYILLFILTVLMFVPVVSVLLTISVFSSGALLIFYAICIDAAVYLLRAVLGKSFIKQYLTRYFKIFKEAGKKHDEKNYEKWLRNHREEFEEDVEYRPRRKRRDFYEDDDEYEQDYEDEYLEEYDESYGDDYSEDEYEEDCDKEYEDEYSEDEDYEDYGEDYEEDEEYDDDDYEDEEYDEEFEEDYEDDYDDPRSKRASSASSTFDFFAGCNSRESLDRKYKSLVKLYHPDNMDGDTSALQEINTQYDKAKKSGRFT